MPSYFKVKKGSESIPSVIVSEKLASLVGNVRIQDSQKKVEFIHNLVDEECWLACNCQDQYKYLFPVMQAKSFHFRRRSVSDFHSPDCHFHKLAGVRYYDGDIVTIPPKETEIFDLCKKSGIANQRDRGDGSDKISREVRLSKLGRLLLYAMSKAGLNIQSNNSEVTVHQQFERLTNSFEEIFYDNSRAISEILFTSFEAFGKTQERLNEMEQCWTSHRTEPHGFVVTLIKRIRRVEKGYKLYYCIFEEGNEQLLESSFTIHQSYFKSRLKMINGYLSLEKGGPWIGIFLIRKTKQYDNNPNTFSFLPVRAFLYPVYSTENLFPIESDKERKVFDEIIRSLNYNKPRNNICRVEKPLFSEPNDDETIELGAIQPDFLIKSESTCVLEVMGLTDYDYRLRKKELEKYYNNKNVLFLELDATSEGNKLQIEIEDKVRSAFRNAIFC